MNLNEQSKKRARGEEENEWEDIEEEETKPRKIVKAKRKAEEQGLKTGEQNSDMECEDS